tara:strand:- start:261 stop:767 length:507 start_codon:yes stop_codon:yes gene_type:complete
MALTRLGPNQSLNLASNVTGTLPAANGGTGLTSFAKGKIVQVAQSVSTTVVTPSSATVITSLSFTPTSSSNKVLLFANCAQIRKADAGTGSAASIRIFVDSTATNAQSSNEGYPESESDTRGNITTTGHHDCWSGAKTVSVKSDGFGSNISYSYQSSPTTLIVMEVEQ